MKYLIATITIAVLLCNILNAQDVLFAAKLKKEQVPIEVITSFTDDFGKNLVISQYKVLPIQFLEEHWVVAPIALDTDLEYDTNQVVYSGENMKGHAIYNARGKFLSSYVRHENVALPKPIQKSLITDFAGWHASKSHAIITINEKGLKKAYIKVLTTKGNLKQMLTYSPAGKIVKIGNTHKMTTDLK